MNISLRSKRWLLIGPAILFLLAFFFIPIGGFLLRSIDNSEVVRVIPETVAALEDWEPGSPVPDRALEILIKELRIAGDNDVAQLARRMNYVIPDYRRLLISTADELKTPSDMPTKENLLQISKKWSQEQYWMALRDSAGAHTTYYFETALDLERGSDGSLQIKLEGERLFLNVLARTFTNCILITALCVVIDFPVANVLAGASPRAASVMLFFVLLPFWTSLLVRTSAWVILLQREGILNNFLIRIGLISEPLSLIFNKLGIYIAMVHVMLPFAILPLYASMRKIPKHYLQAASSLGARPVGAFFKIYLPQTYPAIFSSATLIFVLALGYYITPALVGGPGDQMIGAMIAFYTNTSLNWGLASALSVILLLITAAFFAAMLFAIGRKPQARPLRDEE